MKLTEWSCSKAGELDSISCMPENHVRLHKQSVVIKENV